MDEADGVDEGEYLRYWDPGHQRSYYVHKLTGKATWLLPTPEVEPEPEEPEPTGALVVMTSTLPRQLCQNPYRLSETFTSAKTLAQVFLQCVAMFWQVSKRLNG